MIISEKQITQMQFLLQEFISFASAIAALQHNSSIENLFDQSKKLLCIIANQQSDKLIEVKDE